MKPTSRRMPRLRVAAWLAAGSSAAAALLLWTSVAATPASDAALLCPTGIGGSLLSNSTRLTTEAKLFQASYSTSDWTGGLRAIGINADGSLSNASDWDANGPGKIPAADQRRIFTSNGTSGIAFTWAALGAAGLQSRIGSEALLNYLRGDQANEQSQANPNGFRQRSARLGAIVQSEIAYAGLEDFGYDALVDVNNPSSPASVAGLAYAAYLQTKLSRTKLVIVGANDGMLHGVDADTGVEKFAYVPRTLLQEPISVGDPRSTLVRLAEANFSPRYYVDGSPWVGDAYWGGAWHTTVVATTGAGGKGVFALDITDPDAMTAGKVLWDVDGQADANMGYAFGEPVIGRLHDGNFYAIFGNGRESQNQCAVLYLVRLDNGQVRKIPTGGRTLTATCPSAPSGLGRPSLYDVDQPGATGYRTTDFVYAGDLQGNLWRFDLRSVNLTNDPPTGAGVQLMFAARNGSNQVQPITGTIEIGAAPSGVTGSPPPAMLWFGTGRYLTDSDRSDATVQSMYGMVDRFASGGNANSAKVSRSDLQVQTASVGNSGEGTISNTAVDYTGTGNSRRDGWYMDLPRSRERMVGLPLIQTGRLFFSTLIPDTGSCIGGGASSIFVVDPYNGRRLSQRAFVNHPGVDFIASSVGIVRSLVSIDAGIKAYLYAGGTTASGGTGSTIQFEEIQPVQQASPRGRVSWREIVK